MAISARLNGLMSIKLSSALIALVIGTTTAHSAHAEQYCKSVDRSGNASYTLAPETGCNKKKFKTVAVNHHTVPKVETQPLNTPSEKPVNTTPAVQTTPIIPQPNMTPPSSTPIITKTPTSNQL